MGVLKDLFDRFLDFGTRRVNISDRQFVKPSELNKIGSFPSGEMLLRFRDVSRSGIKDGLTLVLNDGETKTVTVTTGYGYDSYGRLIAIDDNLPYSVFPDEYSSSGNDKVYIVYRDASYRNTAYFIVYRSIVDKSSIGLLVDGSSTYPCRLNGYYICPFDLTSPTVQQDFEAWLTSLGLAFDDVLYLGYYDASSNTVNTGDVMLGALVCSRKVFRTVLPAHSHDGAKSDDGAIVNSLGEIVVGGESQDVRVGGVNYRKVFSSMHLPGLVASGGDGAANPNERNYVAFPTSYERGLPRTLLPRKTNVGWSVGNCNYGSIIRFRQFNYFGSFYTPLCGEGCYIGGRFVDELRGNTNSSYDDDGNLCVGIDVGSVPNGNGYVYGTLSMSGGKYVCLLSILRGISYTYVNDVDKIPLVYFSILNGVVQNVYDLRKWSSIGSSAVDSSLVLGWPSFGSTNGVSIIPRGVIVMWSGSVNNIPRGWVLCDGVEKVLPDGTRITPPNLLGRFIVGAGGAYEVGWTGGEEKHTLTTNELPSHTHAQNAHSHTGTTNTSGAHTHDIYGGPNGYPIVNAGSPGAVATGNNPDLCGRDQPKWQAASAGGHTHTFTTDSATAKNQNAGGGQAHENRPPYYALAYIMKV